MDIRALIKPLSVFAAVFFLLGVIAVFADRPVNAVSEREILLPDFARQIDAAQAWKLCTDGACRVPSRCLSSARPKAG